MRCSRVEELLQNSTRLYTAYCTRLRCIKPYSKIDSTRKHKPERTATTPPAARGTSDCCLMRSRPTPTPSHRSPSTRNQYSLWLPRLAISQPLLAGRELLCTNLLHTDDRTSIWGATTFSDGLLQLYLYFSKFDSISPVHVRRNVHLFVFSLINGIS
jgi:hypothetical protein